MTSEEVKHVASIWQVFWQREAGEKASPNKLEDSYACYFWEGYLKHMIPIIRNQHKGLIGLEVGVGTGTLLEKIRNETRVEIVGLDVSSVAIREAKSHIHAPPLVLGDVFHLPFRYLTFDFTICLGLVEHFKDSITPSKNMIQLTRKGGYLFISVPQRGSLYAPWKRWQMIRRIWPFGFEKEFSENDLKRICRKLDLADTKIVSVDFYPSFLKILPFESLLRPIIVKVTGWLEMRKRIASRFAHMLMAVARRNHEAGL